MPVITFHAVISSQKSPFYLSVNPLKTPSNFQEINKANNSKTMI